MKEIGHRFSQVRRIHTDIYQAKSRAKDIYRKEEQERKREMFSAKCKNRTRIFTGEAD